MDQLLVFRISDNFSMFFGVLKKIYTILFRLHVKSRKFNEKETSRFVVQFASNYRDPNFCVYKLKKFIE